MGEFVTLSVDGGVGVIRLDRPPANAIDHRVGIELREAVEEAGRRCGAIVVWGGPKLFAAGADIKEMAGFGPDEIRPVVAALGDALNSLEAFPVVSIAAITGYALGGGLELALACDLRYASEDAKLGQPEIRIGVIPGAGGTQRLTHLVGPGRARELVYKGRQVDAGEALAIGLVERVLPPGEVFEAALADARAFATGPREALAAAKRSIRSALSESPEQGLAREREAFVGLFGTLDQREGMRAFLEKRAPSFGGGDP
ncbi:MAG: enoyl-CoA hydratase/isomerase family protein [Actinobacteria bacterium]|nr:enoyl-CoA hydratase/isomerase family protein [Actinomycetota bacterium]